MSLVHHTAKHVMLPAVTLGIVAFALALNAIYFGQNTNVSTRADQQATIQTFFDFDGTLGDWRVENMSVLAHQHPRHLVSQVTNLSREAALVSPMLRYELEPGFPMVQVSMRVQPMERGRFIGADRIGVGQIPVKLMYMTDSESYWDNSKSVGAMLTLSAENQVLTFDLSQTPMALRLPNTTNQVMTFLKFQLEPTRVAPADTLELAVEWVDVVR